MDLILAEDDNLGIIVVNIVNAVANLPPVEIVRERRQPARNRDYFEATIPLYTLDEFKAHFRMRRDTMQNLLQAIGNHIQITRQPIINLEKKLLLTIWLLAKPETFLACGDRFGLSKGSAHYIFREIVHTLSGMVNEYIKWPNQRQIEENSQIFLEKSGGIRNVIGAIDGSHIFIKQPVGNAIDYFNRYQQHSVIVQGVCDATKKIINISVGHPGRMHDARVFRRSQLYQANSDDENPLIKNNQHLIGDCAYPLLREVLTPFRNTGHLTPEQINYNTRFSSIRSIIERAFGRLKGKWRRLKYLDMSYLNLMNEVITAACVLHNFTLQEDDDSDDEDDIENDDDLDNVPEIQLPERVRHALGEAKRDEIVNLLI